MSDEPRMPVSEVARMTHPDKHEGAGAPASPDAAPAASLTEAPELPVACFSFVLHFVWEFLQVPIFAGMAEMPHWEGIRLCLSATIGDVGFALTSFWLASLAARRRDWILRPTKGPVAVFLGVGLVLTIGFEYYYTTVTLRWTYAEVMPLVPPFGTGLSPLLQWIAIPSAVIWLTRRHLVGARAIRRGRG
jgi:hypothetical protein